MCTCKDDQNKSCPCSQKWLYLILALAALGGLTWWYLKKKKQAG